MRWKLYIAGEKMKKKLHIEKISGGAKIFKERSYGALKNLIPAAEGLVKRNGHKTITRLTDKNGKNLRINGIYSYSYTKNGETYDCRIVHAGACFIKLDKDFKYIGELEIAQGVTIKDQRSRAFLRNELLYIIGAGDILICDGETIKSAYNSSDTYIPTTAKMITDRKAGMRCEAHQSPNMLNPRRKNKLIGGSTHKKLNEPNLFVLDGEIDFKKPIIIDVKIRTKTSEDADNDYTTSYIGINEAGEEVSTVVNLRYVRDSVDDSVIFFLIEPMRNERGEKIKIKIGEKVYDYDTVPFGVRLRGHREISFGFDVDAPYPNEENITVEYESVDEYRNELYDVEMGALATHEGGKEILLLTRGENEILYSDPVYGFSYLPRENKITLGGSDKITSLVQLWDNLIGVFKENSFYRVRFGDDTYEALSSADSLGAYSANAVSICGSDCLVLSGQGVFGVDDYKSSARQVCLLSPRSLDIDFALSEYTREDKKDAFSIVHSGKYYLFIGEDCYVGVPKSSGKSEYDWYPWYGFGARVSYSFDGELYFGTSNGEIRKMHSGYQDITINEYSTETLSLIIDNEGEKTRLVTDKASLENDTIAKIEAHLLYIGNAKISSGALLFRQGSPCYPDGSAKLFFGDTLILKGKAETTEGVVIGVAGNIAYLDGEMRDITAYTELDEGSANMEEYYDVYLKKQSGIYEAKWENGAIFLKTGGEVVKIEDFSSVVLETRVKIPSEYKTSPLSIGTHTKNATLTRLYLNVYSGTEGKIETEISTRAARYKKEITTAPPLDFEGVDFNRLDMTYGLDAHLAIPYFVRGFDYLDVKISANDEKPVYIGFLMLEYYAS